MESQKAGMNEESEFIVAVEEGLRALAEGRVLSHEEVKARFGIE
jgi:predicted transcriptional regulator